MAKLKARGPLAEYGQGATSAEVNYASPHRLVQMLLEGALEKIAVAKGALARNEVKKKIDHITWAISIINGLRMSLDHGAGGAIARIQPVVSTATLVRLVLPPTKSVISPWIQQICWLRWILISTASRSCSPTIRKGSHFVSMRLRTTCWQ